MTDKLQIQNAEISFNDSGTPISNMFDDIYFSNSDGLKECFYVFVQQNQLPQRFAELAAPMTKTSLSIGETGFGTGLNLMAAWAEFNRCVTNPEAKLQFTSFEKYPLNKQDLAKALNHWPEVGELAKQLIEAYPSDVTSDIKIALQDGQVEVNILLGDVNDRIAEINANELSVDAWFLDGFAPSKNPDMWTDSLFEHMARLSTTSATLATFTAAGFVRRGLQSVGFDMRKCKGFGTKREMLIGQRQG